jgi:hypothetical protein
VITSSNDRDECQCPVKYNIVLLYMEYEHMLMRETQRETTTETDIVRCKEYIRHEVILVYAHVDRDKDRQCV